MVMVIQKAEKFQQYARICLWGVPKVGKTHAALAMAKTLAGPGGKIGVISSEYGSSALLSRKFAHDILDKAHPQGKQPIIDTLDSDDVYRTIKMNEKKAVPKLRK